MKPSALQLERYFFAKIELHAHASADPKVEPMVQCRVEVGMAVDNPRRFQVTLHLKLQSAPQQSAGYTGEFQVVGFFHVQEAWPEEQTLQLVETNGPAMLYGALREMVYTLTARGPWPAVTLQSVTFLQAPDEAGSTQPVTMGKAAIHHTGKRRATRKTS